MAQLFTDFSGVTVGEQPPSTTLRRGSSAGDWTRQDDVDPALRYLPPSGVAARGLSYDAVGSAGVTEMFIEVRDADDSDNGSGRLVCFASDGPDNEYGAYLRPANSSVVVYRRVDGSFTSIVSLRRTLSTSVRYGVRLRVTPGSPNQIKLRYWDITVAEPTDWDIDTTSSALTLTTGWVGHVGFDPSTIFYYRVGVGTDGDPAPTEAVDPGTAGALLGPNGGLLRGPNGGLLRLAP